MKQLTTRQTAMILFLGVIAIKLMAFPSVSFKTAGNVSYFSVILSFVLDFVSFYIFLSVMSKFPNQTFRELSEESFGKIFTKFLYIMLFVYLFSKSVVIIKETHGYFLEVLYDELRWSQFILPLFIILGYIMLKSLKTLGRTVEFLFYVIILGIAFSILFSLDKVDFSNLLPISFDFTKKVLESVYKCAFSYGDYLILIIFMGRVKFEKNTKRKLLIAVFIAMLLVLIFIILFISLFGDSAISQYLSLSQLSLSSTQPVTIGRLDWITVMMWAIALILQTGVLLYCCKDCLKNILDVKSEYVPVFIIEFLLIIAVSVLYLSLEITISIVTSPEFSIFAITIQALFPFVLFPIISAMKTKKNNGGQHEIIKKNN